MVNKINKLHFGETLILFEEKNDILAKHNSDQKYSNFVIVS